MNYQFYSWLFDLIFKMRTMGYIQELGLFFFLKITFLNPKDCMDNFYESVSVFNNCPTLVPTYT